MSELSPVKQKIANQYYIAHFNRSALHIASLNMLMEGITKIENVTGARIMRDDEIIDHARKLVADLKSQYAELKSKLPFGVISDGEMGRIKMTIRDLDRFIPDMLPAHEIKEMIFEALHLSNGSWTVESVARQINYEYGHRIDQAQFISMIEEEIADAKMNLNR